MPNSQASQSGGDVSVQNTGTPGGSKNVKGDERKARLLHILPKLPSSDSLSNSPGPSSPGIFTNTMFTN